MPIDTIAEFCILEAELRILQNKNPNATAYDLPIEVFNEAKLEGKKIMEQRKENLANNNPKQERKMSIIQLDHKHPETSRHSFVKKEKEE